MTSRITQVLFTKFSAWVLFFFIGLYWIFPNLFNRDPINWSTRFAMSNINLGIDLKGGTYITLGVDIDKAVENFVESRGREITKFLQKKKIADPTSRVIKNQELVLTFADQDAASAARNALQNDTHMQSIFSVTSSGNVLTATLPSIEVQRIRANVVDQAINILRGRLKRKDLFLEASVQQHGSRQIVVQLPSLDDASRERIKQLITARAFLEFKIIKGQAASKKVLEDRYDGEIPPNLMIIADRADADEMGGGVRWYLVERYADLSGDHMTEARVTRPDETSGQVRPVVSFTLDSEGARLFHEITAENTGKQLGIVIDNVLFSAPTINEPIAGGSGMISSSNFTWQTASDLAHILNTGSFQAPVKFEQEKHIGPSLGQDSIRRGLFSCIIALMLLFLFSIVIYKVAGIFATMALIYNLFLILFCLSVFHGTLTLPGIAGLVLTLGMAVDASILIYEKIREELAAGVPLRQAVHAGFTGLIMVIFDSNFTTLGTGVILYYLGGPTIQGFALTLIVGIIATLIAGIFFLKSLFNFLIDTLHVRHIKF